MEQATLFEPERVVVIRWRADGRIEARWMADDLCSTCSDWAKLMMFVFPRIAADTVIKVRA